MPDREKVIKGLEFHLKELKIGKTCFGCPYLKDDPCEIQLIENALALLKEQETDKKDAEYVPMEVIPVTIGNDYRTWLCSNCGSKLKYKKELICPKCHKKIDWEGR